MSDRLKILFLQDRHTRPSFKSSELAELFRTSLKDIKSRAKLEGWQSFKISEVEENGKIYSYPVWNVLSMPPETRIQIAAAHYAEEEADSPLLVEAETEARQVQLRFPKISFPVIRAAIYRARQFSLVDDAIVSLELLLSDAIEAISLAYRIDPGILSLLERQLSANGSGPFLLLAEEIRFFCLVQHFSENSGELLPEFSPDRRNKELKWN